MWGCLRVKKFVKTTIKIPSQAESIRWLMRENLFKQKWNVSKVFCETFFLLKMDAAAISIQQKKWLINKTSKHRKHWFSNDKTKKSNPDRIRHLKSRKIWFKDQIQKMKIFFFFWLCNDWMVIVLMIAQRERQILICSCKHKFRKKRKTCKKICNWKIFKLKKNNKNFFWHPRQHSPNMMIEILCVCMCVKVEWLEFCKKKRKMARICFTTQRQRIISCLPSFSLSLGEIKSRIFFYSGW